MRHWVTGFVGEVSSRLRRSIRVVGRPSECATCTSGFEGHVRGLTRTRNLGIAKGC